VFDLNAIKNNLFGIAREAKRKSEQAVTALNQEGSKVYGALNQVYNQADRAVGGALPYGVRPQSRPTSTRRRGQGGGGGVDITPVTDYIREVPDKGLIPVPTFNATNEALVTAGKYAAGPFGRAYRPLRSQETKERLQQQVDSASVRDGQLIFGLGEPGYESTRFPSNVEGAGIVGQWIGRPNANNEVVVSEPYDTKPIDWHGEKLNERFSKGDFGGAAESAGNIVFRGLSDIGWANQYPRGTTQVIGELKPGHPLYRAQR
jgi:hypothetical protein